MIKKLTKREFEILYYISMGSNSLERLSGLFGKKEILANLNSLEKKNLLKISYRDGEIYGFMETEEARTLLKSDRYEKWYSECGD